MTQKIFKNVMILAAVVLLVTAFVVFGFTYNSYHTLALDEMSRECELILAGYEADGEDYFASIEHSGVRVTRVLTDGTVVFDSLLGDNVGNADNHIDREEIQEAILRGEGSAVRDSDTIGRSTIYYAMRAHDGSIIRVGTEHYSVLSLLLRLLTPALLLFILVLLFAFMMAANLAKNIVTPINQIDLQNPMGSVVFEELRPIVQRLSEQNYRISRQMKELSIRQNEFDSIMANMSEGMMVLNSRASILSCNRAAAEILNISDETKSLLSVSLRSDIKNSVLKALSGDTGTCVIRIEERCYTVIATPVKLGERIEGAVVLIVDDTEKEEREQLRREFTSNVSHELKTPLTSISGFAELIRDGFAIGEDATRFAGKIHKEAQRLIDLVGDIIRLTQMDGGEIPYDGEVGLDSIASDVVDRLSAVAEKKGVSLECALTPTKVVGNIRLLEEMIYNLLDNAIKYNKEGGRVIVSVKKSDTGATLSVIDNGIGIPKTQQSRVFERFYRVDKSHSREIGGTGLGLSIVKHSCIYHKARIELESELDVGTTVTVYFPPIVSE